MKRERQVTETTTDPERRTWSFNPRSMSGDLLPGPWDNEPDKIQWVDPATNFDCLMVRNHYAAWCGYVGVPQTHPLYKVGYHEAPDFYVHGGITFTDLCQPGEPLDGICHIAEPGREDKPWWFGFDCAHGGDIMPGMIDLFDQRLLAHMNGDIYRHEEYVTNQVTGLARQLADFAQMSNA